MAQESEIVFHSSLTGTAFTGQFEKFSGTIVFDPEDLSTAQADITIDITSASTDTEGRDEEMASPDWFDTQNYPNAYFKSTDFEHIAGDDYRAKGQLTVRDVTLPVTLPFTLKITQGADGQQVADMTSKLTLNRLDYGVGQNEWADDSMIDAKVQLNIKVKAISAPNTNTN